MASIPTTMRALVGIDDTTSGVKSVPVPTPEEGEVLVKVDYVSQNPTDWKHVETRTPPGAIVGCDFTGHVVSSPDASSGVKVGDRVAGVVHGGLFKDKGSFAEYLRVPADLVWTVPEGLKPEDAATFGIPFYTAFHALVQSQGAPWPPAKEGGWILIYGGSTGVGLFAIQLAKALGYKVATTCSPHSNDLVKRYGADFVANYRDGDKAIAAIKDATGGGVTKALDCISEKDSEVFSVQCFKEGGGVCNIILFPEEEAMKKRPDVKLVPTLLYTWFGKAFNFGPRTGPDMPIPAVPAEREFHAEFCKRAPGMITELGFKAPPVEVRGGLEDIPQGFADMKANKISGKRLVYKV